MAGGELAISGMINFGFTFYTYVLREEGKGFASISCIFIQDLATGPYLAREDFRANGNQMDCFDDSVHLMIFRG